MLKKETMTAQEGSPPQVRGKRYIFSVCVSNIRITPAGAGKTLVHYLLGNGVKDHPRRCGENKNAQQFIKNLLGSPPQVRGKHRNCRQYAYQHRITPAGAGKTC